MVNAIGVIELAGLCEAATPPCKIILLDNIPAVSRESPVLAAVAEHVRRSTRTVFQREVLAVGPYIGAVFVNQDRNVALQTEAHLRNFFDHGAELLFGFELHPGLEQVILLELFPKLFDILGRRIAEFGPILPAGFAVHRLQSTIDAIRL